MVLGFIKRLLGGGDTKPPPPPSPAARPQPQAAPPAMQPAAPRAVVETPRTESGIVIQRDEMLDGRARIAGYRFTAKRFGSGAPLTAQQIATALGNDNLAAFVLRRHALVVLGSNGWSESDFAPFISPNTSFFIPTPPGDRQAWGQALSAIQAAGGRVAVDARGLDACPVAPDLLLLDFTAYQLEAFERVVRHALASHPRLTIAVDGIPSWTEHRLCNSLGVHFSLGGFAATRDEQVQGERLSQSRLVLVEMLNLMRRDGTPAEIAAVAKRDPAVAVKILGMANSPMSGLTSPVASFERAMMVLGRETLYRWLSLAMFRAGETSSRDETLLELALFRGRFLELLATGSRSKAECDELFLVGLLSLVDNLLGLPMAEVVAKMHLPQAVADVLLGNGGPHSRWLMLALAIEKGRTDSAPELTATLGVDPERLEECVSAARSWADEALQSS